jgi:hypothetical protein
MVLIMWANSGFLFAARVVFPDEAPETGSAICFDNSDLRRLFRHLAESHAAEEQGS